MDRGARKPTVHKVAESQTTEVTEQVPSSGLTVHGVFERKTMAASTLRAALAIISSTK